MPSLGCGSVSTSLLDLRILKRITRGITAGVSSHAKSSTSEGTLGETRPLSVLDSRPLRWPF